MPMRSRVIIDDLDAHDVQMMIQRAVETATSDLRKEVAHLRDELRRQRRVITHHDAPAYFADRVTPDTVRDYILHQGLPAHKQGQIWFIELKDLEAWQMGRLKMAAIENERRAA